MRTAECPDLVESIMAETIPMHARMIHARNKLGDLYQESQEYDIHHRVSLYPSIRYALRPLSDWLRPSMQSTEQV
jgi:hypothetical protein